MEPRKEVLKQTQQQRKEATQSRFKIVKLEERIAPGKPGTCFPYGCPQHGHHGHGAGK